MSLFGNQNFMSQIAKEMGCPNLSEEVAAMLQVLVEIQARKVIQKAGKFMYNDRRDLINFDDVNIAMQDLGHEEIMLVDQDEQYTRDGSSFIRRDPIFKSAKEFLEQQMKGLTTQLSGPSKLRGRWIYIDGKIPGTAQNKSLKNKTEIINIRQKQLGEKNKKFNIITDQPESMLTGFQLEYYREVTSVLSDQTQNISKLQEIDVTGNLSNLFPLFLKYFLSSEITDMKMIYFMGLLKNRYIEKSTELHLHQIITYLWAYEGYLSLKIGQIMGSYIQKYGQKYAILYTVWMQSANEEKMLNQQSRITAYNNTMKKIGIQLETGIQIPISQRFLECIQEDCSKDLKIACLCKEILIEYSGKIQCLRRQSVHENYWIPGGNGEIVDQEFLMMNL